MIERNFVNQKMKEERIREYMLKTLSKAGYSKTEIQRTPVGEKVVIYTTRPGIVVGKKGENIKRMTAILKNKFKLENPQIEIGEVKNPFLDAHFVAGRIASSMERFGSKRFKSIGYRTLQSIMDAGATGAEIVLSGKIPSKRARSWRFFSGYMKKSGDIAVSMIPKAILNVVLKTGTVGIKVSIMTPDIKLMERELEKALKKEIQVEEITPEKEETTEEKEEIKEEKKPAKKEEPKAEEKPVEKKEETVEKSEEKTEEPKEKK